MRSEIRQAISSVDSGGQLSPQRLINGYPELQPPESGAKSNLAVYGSPGISDWTTIGTGPIRGFTAMNGVGYVVSGQEFYSFNSAGTATLLGAGITGIAPVSIDNNGFEIVIVNGELGFSYLEASTSFTQIGDADFQRCNTVTCINNIFAYDWKDTNKFFLSEILDGRTYDALSFASAESNPDRVRAVRNRKGILFIFGETTIEAWDHTGAYNFPFQRFKGGTIGRGLRAPLAIEEEDEALFFLGDDLVMYRLSGLQIRRVSTHALEKTWAKFTTTEDAFCFKVIYGGHKFIYLTFPTEGRTYGFDIAANNLWHERMSFDATGADVKWRANASINIFNKTLVGDANSGRIGLLDPETYTEFGDPIVTTLVFPNYHANGRRCIMNWFEADMEVGVGATSGQGVNPQIMLTWSNDGGKTYVPFVESLPIGRRGEYGTIVKWDRLGEFYQRVMKVSVSDPVERVFHSFRADMDIDD
ncbi:MAG: hypothetical protein E6Q97_24775 [Desulfurellales bacterium]|nr:MAG: hypothetical protein E6Q97_24775 [Desulfurellales bacterium]